MKKETVLGYIHDQPRALVETFEQSEVFVKPFVEFIESKKIKKILFFGSGTSYNASLIASYYFKQLSGIDASGNYPTVFKNYEKADWSGCLDKEEILFVGISQSGTSISTIDVMKKAKIDGYNTIALTENMNSEITKHVDLSIHLLCGKEVTPPETRGYTVTILTLFLWAISTARSLKKIDEQDYLKHLQDADLFVRNFGTVISESENWYDNNCKTIINSERLYILGYGIDYGSALEGMLKIGEMLRLPALGYELEEYSHGPTMAITNKQTILIIASDEAEFKRCMQFQKAFKKYTDRVHIFSMIDIDGSDDRDCIFSVKTNKYLAPIAFTVPMQFVAAKGAKDIGIDTGENPFKEELSHLQN